MSSEGADEMDKKMNLNVHEQEIHFSVIRYGPHVGDE